MSVLVVQGLKKTLGAFEVLSGVDLRVDWGEKVGCVGRNGVGKTTFLRLLEGEESPDTGQIQLAKRARIGYVTQRPEFPEGVTVRSYVEGGLDEVKRVEGELEAASEAMGEAQGEELEVLMKRHGELTARMEFLGGWESERRVETVLGGIGLPQNLWDRDANLLSGGEKSRTAMARELVSVPDLLLLDEPTNHLDVAGIEWLEEYLNNIGSAVLMVSHDRRMLDRVVDAIVEFERGSLVRYIGNYTRYVSLKEERFDHAWRAWKQQQDMIRKEEHFIRKHMGSQRTAEAKGRQKKLRHVVRLPQPHNDVRKPVIKSGLVERGGEQILEAEGLAVGHPGTELLSDVNVRIGRGERIGIVGPNGSGKTTLLKTLAGRHPALRGEIKLGYKAQCGFYDQETSDLRSDSTVYGEIRRDHPQMTDQEIRSHLARFLFREDGVELEVSSLSGGERGRLTLAKLVLTGPSWMALDEPTNHLDLASRTAVEEFLGAFPGAFLCVSHDREFLDRLCNRILEVKDGQVRSFPGNYSDYRREILREAEERSKEPKKSSPAPKSAKNKSQPSPKSKAKAKQEAPRKSQKPRNPWRFKKLEEEIIQLEDKRETILQTLATEATYKDPDATRDLQVELAEVERDLEQKNHEWESWA